MVIANFSLAAAAILKSDMADTEVRFLVHGPIGLSENISLILNLCFHHRVHNWAQYWDLAAPLFSCASE